MLTYIQTTLFFSFDTFRIDCQLPFKKITTMEDLIDKVNYIAPVLANVDYDSADSLHLYQHLFDFMQRIWRRLNIPPSPFSNPWLMHYQLIRLTTKTKTSLLLLAIDFQMILATMT